MTWPPYVILALGIGYGIAIHLQSRRMLRRFWDRGCMGRAWRRAFPVAAKHEIRDFLGLVVHSLGLPSDKRLALSPDDRIIDLYRALYPPGSMADAMELETLAEELGRLYAVDVSTWCTDMTLAELFVEATRGKQRLTS
jgi:hypothetical protein